MYTIDTDPLQLRPADSSLKNIPEYKSLQHKVQTKKLPDMFSWF